MTIIWTWVMSLVERVISEAVEKASNSALEKLYFPGLEQSTLACWSPASRGERIRSAVDHSLLTAERHADAVLRRLIAIERHRMIGLLGNVIDADLARSAFTVEALEERLEYRHAGVRLAIRADRIDRLSDASLLIVDYKTGRPGPLIRKDGEPADLQLPIYASAVRHPVGGLGLMFARPRDISWRLIGPSVDVKPIDAEEWARTLNAWRASIAALIEGIVRGDVRVNLRGDAERSWQLNVLCRAAEQKRAG